jgi:hypothetical protein
VGSAQENSETNNDSLKRRFIFMGILNVIFAPFIIVYLLMYSFFRYFEVIQCFSSIELTFAGIPQKPIVNWRASIYAVCPVEVSRVQRAATSIQAAFGPKLSGCQDVHRSVSQGAYSFDHAVSLVLG